MKSHVERTSFDNPTLPRLAVILDEVQRGIWRVPAFQRPSVWRDDERRDLLDSIIKGLPIGSFLVWRTSFGELGAFPDIAGVPIPAVGDARGTYTWLIDGHQRLTTLFGALTERPGGRRRSDPWNIHYELGCGEDPALRLPRELPRSGEVPLHYLPLSILRNGKAFFEFRDGLYRAGRDELVDEAMQVQNRFMDYIVPVIPLVSDELDLVTDAFVRINSRGRRMTEAHMLRALTHLKTHDTATQFKRLRESLAQQWWALDDQVLVNTLKAMHGLDVYRSGVEALNAKLKAEPDSFERLKVALDAALAFLAGQGVRGVAALPYTYHLVVLAAVEGAHPGRLADHQDEVKRWFWRIGYSEAFTGATGAGIQREIDRLLGSPADPVELPPAGRPGRLRQGSTRATLFTLFLVNAVEDPARRQERQQRAGEQRALTRIFPGCDNMPGNLIIADMSEVRALRQRLLEGAVTDADRDAFGLPQPALDALPDEAAFIERRSDLLWQAERDFIQGLGLEVRELGDLSDDELDESNDSEDT